jgi:hypothetical protein
MLDPAELPGPADPFEPPGLRPGRGGEMTRRPQQTRS